MKKLTKGPAPHWIEQNQRALTAAYEAAPVETKPSPWRAAAIVAALKSECNRKCMYCESFIDGSSYSAVEHIRPKSLFEDQVLEWNNLGLVCPRCNTNKREYWTDDENLQLLNPYVDDPEDHIEFHGPMTVARPTSSRGVNTVRKLKFFARADLLISRLAKIEALSSAIVSWHNENCNERKQLLAEDITELISERCEFSAVLTSFACKQGFPLPAVAD